MSETGKVDRRWKHEQWWLMFGYLKAYLEQYGDLNVPYSYVVIGDDGQEINLGHWFFDQRFKLKDQPGSERYKALKKIGMVFEIPYSPEWYEMFLLAKQFYEKNGNLRVPQEFVTTSDYTEEGKKLGIWIHHQRRICKPKSAKYFLLDCIGMIWNTEKNKFNLAFLCNGLNIDVEKNKKILAYKSASEIRVKAAYIVNLLGPCCPGVDIIDEYGCLHDIFSMSDDDMFAFYNVTMEILFSLYGNIENDELIKLYKNFKFNQRIDFFKRAKKN